MERDIEKFNDELRFQARSDYSYWNSVAKEELENIKKRDAEFKKWLRESTMDNELK